MRSLFALAVVSLSAMASAQFVVPSKGNTSEPNLVYRDLSAQTGILYGTTTATLQGSRTQYVYDVADIPVAMTTLNAVQARLTRGSSVPATSAGSYTTSISLSVGPNTSTTASTTFASNHGANLAQVFNGTINIPVTPSSPTWPAPWFAPVVFSAPFMYDQTAGSSLVIDVVTTASSLMRSISVEGYTLEGGPGSFEYVDSDCRNSANQTSGGFSWSPGTQIPGGSFGPTISGAPPATPSYAVNAVLFGTGGVGSMFGPLVTPFLINSLGLPSPTGCEIAVGGVFTSLTGIYQDNTTSASVRIPTIAIPNNPGLGGVFFFTQVIGVDMILGNPTLFPLTTVRWTIGTGITVPACVVRRTYDSTGATPTTGTRTLSQAATLRFS